VSGAALYLRAGARARPLRWITLIALVGLVGGLVLAAVGGARRTGSVVDRFARDARAADVSIEWGRAAGLGDLDPALVERLPQVAEAHRDQILFYRGRSDTGRTITNADMGLVASPDVREFSAVDRDRIVAGRRPDPRRVDEIVMPKAAARSLGLPIGSTLEVRYATPAQMAAGGPVADQVHYPFAGPRITLRVVGLSASIPSTTAGGDYPSAQQSPALLRRYGTRIGGIPTLQVFLRHGSADLGPFKAAVERLAGPGGVQFFTTADDRTRRQRSIRIQAAALWLLAALAGISALLAIGQALARLSLLDATDRAALVALGMTRPQLLWIALARAAVIAVAAAPIAVSIAVGLSPLTPVGDLARALEPHPGLDADLLTLAAGAAALVLVCLLAAFPSGWRAAYRAGAGRADPGAASPGVSERLARAGLPPTVVTGVRLALEPGRGLAAIPARTTLVGVGLGVGTVALALVFTASLQHLTRTPRLYGQAWDAQVGDGFGPDAAEEARAFFEGERAIAAYTLASFAEAQIDGRRVGVLGLDPVRGLVVGPTVIDGRLPRASGEALLATRTMVDLHRRVGDVVTVGVGHRRGHVRVVGRGVIPDLSDALRLGHGAVLTYQGLLRLQRQAPRNVVFMRFSAGVNPRREVAALNRRAGADEFQLSGGRPADLQSVGQVDATPLIGAAVLGAIGLATLAHALITAVHRRRRELAVLKTLGFTRSQVRRVIAWQATTIAVVAAAIGLPVGVAVGRLVWHEFGEQLGIVPESVVPATLILLAAPATVVLANLLAAIPARAAARTAPALVLRVE
jgi:putative ABC transport system permease protein